MPSPKNSTNHKASDSVRDAAMQETSAVLQRLGTSLSGLSEVEAATRLEEYGLNEVAREKKRGWLWRFYVAARNPLVILLTVLAIVTFATAQSSSDTILGWLMLAMVVLGLSLRFIQETKADNAAAKLKAMIKVTATVLRDGRRKFPSANLCLATW
jgi:Mg2+-importing ATPase